MQREVSLHLPRISNGDAAILIEMKNPSGSVSQLHLTIWISS
jgi:hypothetical protein